MDQFFSREWNGAPFELFGTPHTVALMIVALVSVALITFGQKLSPRRRKVMRYTLASILGSNYLFIARKPETASLLDVLPPWPWYLPILELIAVIIVGLLYLPFAIKDLRARQATPDTAALT